MNEDRYVEYGAATGMLFVVLTVVGFIIVPSPPDLNAPAQDWASYYLSHHDAVRTSMLLFTIALFFFIWFLGTLTSILRIAAGSPRLPSIAFAGGILGAACLMIGATAEIAAAYRPQGVDPGITRTLNDVFVLVGVPAIPAFAAFFGATAIIILRSGALPAWLGWLLALAAVVQPLTYGAEYTKTGGFAGDGVLGLFIPLIVSLVSIFALSALLTAWAREAAQPGTMSLADRIRGAAAGAMAGARGEPVSGARRGAQ
jgi:hypothetical protein